MIISPLRHAVAATRHWIEKNRAVNELTEEAENEIDGILADMDWIDGRIINLGRFDRHNAYKTSRTALAESRRWLADRKRHTAFVGG